MLRKNKDKKKADKKEKKPKRKFKLRRNRNVGEEKREKPIEKPIDKPIEKPKKELGEEQMQLVADLLNVVHPIESFYKWSVKEHRDGFFKVFINDPKSSKTDPMYKPPLLSDFSDDAKKLLSQEMRDKFIGSECLDGNYSSDAIDMESHRYGGSYYTIVEPELQRQLYEVAISQKYKEFIKEVVGAVFHAKNTGTPLPRDIGRMIGDKLTLKEAGIFAQVNKEGANKARDVKAKIDAKESNINNDENNNNNNTNQLFPDEADDPKGPTRGGGKK